VNQTKPTRLIIEEYQILTDLLSSTAEDICRAEHEPEDVADLTSLAREVIGYQKRHPWLITEGYHLPDSCWRTRPSETRRAGDE
jgi:hypothetical protein